VYQTGRNSAFPLSSNKSGLVRVAASGNDNGRGNAPPVVVVLAEWV
jgi:hypothetical protein